MVSLLQMKATLTFLYIYHKFNSQVLMNYKIIKKYLLMLRKVETVKIKLQT